MAKSDNVERRRRAAEYMRLNPHALDHLDPEPGQPTPTQIQSDLMMLGLTREDLVEASPHAKREVVAEEPVVKYKTRAVKADQEK